MNMEKKTLVIKIDLLSVLPVPEHFIEEINKLSMLSGVGTSPKIY